MVEGTISLQPQAHPVAGFQASSSNYRAIFTWKFCCCSYHRLFREFQIYPSAFDGGWTGWTNVTKEFFSSNIALSPASGSHLFTIQNTMSDLPKIDWSVLQSCVLLHFENSFQGYSTCLLLLYFRFQVANCYRAMPSIPLLKGVLDVAQSNEKLFLFSEIFPRAESRKQSEESLVRWWETENYNQFIWDGGGIAKQDGCTKQNNWVYNRLFRTLKQFKGIVYGW